MALLNYRAETSLKSSVIWVGRASLSMSLHAPPHIVDNVLVANEAAAHQWLTANSITVTGSLPVPNRLPC